MACSRNWGRAIEPSDDSVNSQPMVVISDGMWEREFARSLAVIGQTMKLNDKLEAIVGVNPRSFYGREECAGIRRRRM